MTRRDFLAGTAGMAAAIGCTGGASMGNQEEGPERVVSTPFELGEGPIWHPEWRRVLFLDIEKGRVHSYDPETRESRIFHEGRRTGAMLLQQDGSLLLLQDGHVTIVDAQGKGREVLKGLSPAGVRFNDAIADPEGRVFTGELGGQGRVLRIDPDGKVTELASGYGCPNGWGFTPDLSRIYLTESVGRTIYRFRYNRAKGELSDRQVFAEIPADEGLPDGMTVDADGCVWTAIWFGGRIKRYTPDGWLDREVKFPIRQTSAVCFAGKDWSDMYVTTAATNVADGLKPPSFNPASDPRGDGLYRLRVPGVRGGPSFRSRLKL